MPGVTWRPEGIRGRSCTLRESTPELLGHGFQRIGNDPDLSNGGEEVCITMPAGNDVYMQVFREPGTRGGVLIDADIQPLDGKGSLDAVNTGINEVPEGVPFLRRVLEKSSPGRTQCSKEVTVRIGVAIQHEKAVPITMDHQVLVIMLR